MTDDETKEIVHNLFVGIDFGSAEYTAYGRVSLGDDGNPVYTPISPEEFYKLEEELDLPKPPAAQ